MDPQARIMVLCGKGGVGKTTISLALGLRHANQGRRVVIVSSHPLPELAISVSLDGLGRRFPAAAGNLFVVHLDPRELLQEVVERTFPVPIVAHTILNSSIFRNLVEIAPGLKEFYFLARLQQLAERKRSISGGSVAGPSGSGDGDRDYDVLIWDAPASGHFLGTLRAARAFETYLSGPLAAAGAGLDRFFSSSSNMSILPVTPLEEMALTETFEMSDSLAREFHLGCDALILNLVSPLVTASEGDIASLHVDEASAPALRFAVNRGLAERRLCADIRGRLAAPQVSVPRIRHWDGDLDLLDQIGEWLNIPVTI